MQTNSQLVSDEKPLSTGDVARLLHVTAVGVLRWIRAGKLKAYRVPGGHYRIARAEFRKFLADNQIPVTLDAPPPRRVLVVDDEPTVREAGPGGRPSGAKGKGIPDAVIPAAGHLFRHRCVRHLENACGTR